MQNRDNIHVDPESESIGAHGALMGRDILAAVLLTVAAAVCIVVAWRGAASLDSAKAPTPATEVSEHQRQN